MMTSTFSIKSVVLTIICLLAAVQPSYAANTSFSPQTINAVRNEIQPLDLSVERDYPAPTRTYFDFYRINYKNLKHFFGSYDAGNYKIASHILLPENPKGTIIILHGYFDHTGEIKPLIDLCLSLNYGVATLDLPGHGLSDGDRGAIDHFSEYGDVLDTFLANYQNSLTPPFHLIGHSTGCAAAYEYLSNTDKTPLNKIILLAPLVRSNYWGPSKIALFIVRPFLKKIPRKFTKNSGNRDYLKFVRNDPLEGRYISTRWFNALNNWNKKIVNYSPVSTPALIIQGDLDTTVDWQYNLGFLKEKFTTVTVSIIKGGRHQLPNESDEIAEKVFKGIETFLSAPHQQ